MNKEMVEIRDRDIIDAYFDSMKNVKCTSPYVSRDSIINDMMKKPAPRFYITYDSARKNVSLLCKGKKLPFTNRNKIRMYSDIYRLFLQQKADNKGYMILEDIITSPAPSFYIESFTMGDIVYKALKHRKCRSF